MFRGFNNLRKEIKLTNRIKSQVYNNDTDDIANYVLLVAVAPFTPIGLTVTALLFAAILAFCLITGIVDTGLFLTDLLLIIGLSLFGLVNVYLLIGLLLALIVLPIIFAFRSIVCLLDFGFSPRTRRLTRVRYESHKPESTESGIRCYGGYGGSLWGPYCYKRPATYHLALDIQALNWQFPVHKGFYESIVANDDDVYAICIVGRYSKRVYIHKIVEVNPILNRSVGSKL